MMRPFYLFSIPLMFIFLTTACETSQQQEQEEDGWKSLFDGQSLDNWKIVGGEADYVIEDDAIVGISKYNTPNSFLLHKYTFEDFILELDIKVEHASSNSGVQIRSIYEPEGNEGQGLVYGYQVELDPTDRAWTGGIYDEARRGWLYPLSLNPKAQEAFKMGEYNHFRIEAIDNEIRTWVNGAPAAYLVDDKDAAGFIGLQVHSIGSQKEEGQKTFFRNIRIKTKNFDPKTPDSSMFVVNTILNKLSDFEEDHGWRLLFDGKSNDGWKSAHKDDFPDVGWTINEGVLTIEASDGGESTNAGDIVTTEKFSAFDLAFEFKMTEGANSGVKYFVTLKEGNEGSAIGLEYQILDDEKHPDAKMGRDGNRTLASLYDLITAEKQERFIKPIGEWNSGRIVVTPDNMVTHYLNGTKVLSYERGSESYRNLVAQSKYDQWDAFGEAPEGHILLQDHGDEVSFRNIKLKEL